MALSAGGIAIAADAAPVKKRTEVTRERTITIEAIDTEAQTVTIKGSNGRSVTVSEEPGQQQGG